MIDHTIPWVTNGTAVWYLSDPCKEFSGDNRHASTVRISTS